MSAQRPFKKNQIVQLIIEDLGFEGKGIARVDTEDGKYVVFVPNAIPGQQVEARIIKPKNSFAEAKLVRILATSDLEVSHPYHPIPGAPYISLPIDKQHFYKKKTTIELFKRIGKLEEAETLLHEFIPSPEAYHYRNKMEYSFSAVGYQRTIDEEFNGFVLGFKKRGQWLSVEQLEKDSGLFDAQLENALPQIADYFRDKGFSAWHGLKREGFCRFLTAKRSFKQNGLLLNLVTTSTELDRFDSNDFTGFMQSILGERLLGLVHTLNDDIGDRPLTTDGSQKVLLGNEFITENICGLDFNISLESFFQTNPKSAERLYQRALDYVFESEETSHPVVLDLFSGTGTITQLLAQRSKDKRIIGVELVAQAVADAKKAALANGFPDLEFYAADVGKFLLEHPEFTDQIDTLVMDPPRAGIAPKTLRKVIRLKAKRMVYISCNPATQARDMETLKEAGYSVKKYSLVDQFPHTSHVESVVLFEKD